MGYVLYKAAPTWGLPSYSAASLQIEAYLRLAGVELSAVDCSNSGSSPSGQLPALEDENGAVLASRTSSEYEAARSIMEGLKNRGVDLDEKLTAQQRGQVLAFNAFVESKLEPATLFTTWCEWESYSKHTRVVVGADLPFPLSFIISWSQRRTVQRQFTGRTANEIYNGAALCYEAVAAQLQQTKGDFFLGSQPSSIDAILYGHLAMHFSAPTIAPELRRAVESHPVLKRYVDNLSRQLSSPMPPPPAPSTNPEWSERAEAASSGSRRKADKKMGEQDKAHQRRNWLWLGGAVSVLAIYVLSSGQVIEFDFGYEDAEDVEEE